MSHKRLICMECADETEANTLREHLREMGIKTMDCTLGIQSPTQTPEQSIHNLIQQDRLATLGTLLSGIAHELNNPLHFISLNTEFMMLLRKEVHPLIAKIAAENPDFKLCNMSFDEVTKRAGIALDNLWTGAERIKQLVCELKVYASRQPPVIDESIQLATVIRAATLLTKVLIKRSTHNFSSDVSADLPLITGSFQHIEQVLVHLIQNACQAMPPAGGQLRISAHQDNQNVCISVTDNGCGISDVNLPHITEPFFTTRREQGATGLGLSICQSIIQTHSGTLSVSSTPGNGTTATISLPRP